MAESQTAPRARLMRAGDIDTLPVRDAGVRIAYGDDSLQFGELRLPPGRGPFPVAIVVHGGCWFAPYANVRNAAPRAADHVRALVATYPLDTMRVLAIGLSAGAQIAAWLATRARIEDRSALYVRAPLTLHAVVALGGVMDLVEYQRRQLETCGNPAIESVMGGLPSAVPERYREVSPIERLPLGVPHVHIAGALDRIATRDVTIVFADSARKRGDSAEVITVPALGHHDVMSPRSEAGKAAVEAVVRLLRPAKP